MPVFEFRIRIECDVPIAPVFSHANVLQRIRESLAQSLGGLWPTIAVQSLDIEESKHSADEHTKPSAPQANADLIARLREMASAYDDDKERATALGNLMREAAAALEGTP